MLRSGALFPSTGGPATSSKFATLTTAAIPFLCGDGRWMCERRGPRNRSLSTAHSLGLRVERRRLFG
jgi:hypothetical protein